MFRAALAFVFPSVLHYAFLWGERLLAPIATPLPSFDRLYNRRPLLISVLSGAFFAGASLAQRHTVTFYSLAAIGLALLILDGLACLVSFMGRTKRKRRQ